MGGRGFSHPKVGGKGVPGADEWQAEASNGGQETLTKQWSAQDGRE